MDLKIGVVSKLSGFSPSGIRYFEERGIVSPSHGRDGTYRSFDLPDVARLLECRNYRECGCDTAEIAALLSHGSLCDVDAGLYVAGVDGDFWSTPTTRAVPATASPWPPVSLRATPLQRTSWHKAKQPR